MNQSPQTPTDKLLSPSMFSRLGDSEVTRKVIPRAELQSTLGEIGVAMANDLPNEGDRATLRFEDGSETPMTVKSYTKNTVEVEIPTAGGTVNSNVHFGAFEKLTRATRNELPK